MEDKKPLVSIILITYNSAKYVLETLESIKNQTYQNIEIIISDDASQDNTVDICELWLKENKERFRNSDLLTVEKNTGIPANCNRGIKSASGEWIKLIAGDDAFFGSAIEEFIDFIFSNPNKNVIQTEIISFLDQFEDEKIISKEKTSNDSKFFTLEAWKQFYLLQFKNYLNAPGVFFRKETLIRVNGFDEDFPKIEDYPMWLKLTAMGEQISCANIVTCKYRVHSESVQKSMKLLSYKDHINNRLNYIKKTRKLSSGILFYYKMVEIVNRYKLNKKLQKILLFPIKEILYFANVTLRNLNKK